MSFVELYRDKGYQEVKFDSRDDYVDYMAQFDPEHVMELDVVDSHTGEVLAEKGDLAKQSSYHPFSIEESRLKKQLEDEEFEKELALQDEEEENESRYEKAEKNLQKAIFDFSSNIDLEYHPGLTENDIPDLASEFFYQYPDWKIWAMDLGYTKSEILDWVKDSVFERM